MSNVYSIDALQKHVKEKKSKKEKSKKRKYNGKFNNEAYKLITKFNKFGKEQYEKAFYNSFESVAIEIGKFYNNKSNKIDAEDLFEAFESKKVVNAFLNVFEETDISSLPERELGLYMYMISDFYFSKVKVVREGKKFNKMLEIYKDVNSKRIKKIKNVLKEMGLDKKSCKFVSLKLALMTQSFEGNKNDRHRIRMFNRELITVLKDQKVKPKLIKEMVYACYGKKITLYVSTTIQGKASEAQGLDANEKSIYSAITNVTLSILNKLDKDTRKTIIKKFAKIRENNLNVKRRVAFVALNDSDFKGIASVVDRLIEHGYRPEYFN